MARPPASLVLVPPLTQESARAAATRRGAAPDPELAVRVPAIATLVEALRQAPDAGALRDLIARSPLADLLDTGAVYTAERYLPPMWQWSLVGLPPTGRGMSFGQWLTQRPGGVWACPIGPLRRFLVPELQRELWSSLYTATLRWLGMSPDRLSAPLSAIDELPDPEGRERIRRLPVYALLAEEDLPAPARAELVRISTATTVGEVLDRATAARRPAGPLISAVAAALVRRCARDRLAAADPTDGWPPVPASAPPRIAEAIAALREAGERFELIAGREPRLARDADTVDFQLDPPYAAARLDGRLIGVTLQSPLRFEGGLAQWRAAGCSPHHASAARAVARALVAACGTPVAEALEADLGVPSWERLIADLAIAEGQLGFALRIDKDGPWLATVSVQPGPRGGSRVRLIAADAAAAGGLAVDASERAALEALGRGVASDAPERVRRAAQHDPRRIADALRALRGHDRVWWGDGGTRRLAVEWPVVGLDVRTTDTGVRLEPRLGGAPMPPAIEDAIAAGTEVVLDLVPEEGRVRIISADGALQTLITTLRRRGREFPPEAAAPLLQALGRLERRAELHLDGALAGEEVEPARRLVARIELGDGGVGVWLRARPLPGGRLFVPGEGAPEVYGQDGERRIWARRAPEVEVSAAEAIAAAAGLGPQDGPWDWWIGAGSTDPVPALLADPRVDVEWTGRKGRLHAGATRSAVRLRFRPMGAWFGVAGELQIGGQAVDLAALLLAAEQGRRFVPLGPGEWVELDGELRAALEPLAAAVLASPGRDRVSALHSAALAGLKDSGLTVDAPTAWWSALDRVESASALVAPIPEGLRAELRPYQEEGFRWMARLAEWSGGAVLADDMGLGKTVQALALLLRRADGPALVVAPASVVFNWEREAARFAPSLHVRLHRGATRGARLGSPGPGDVVLTSWDLLVRDVGPLGATRWRTVVFDEAHALKNPATRRSQAARALDAEFRLALTGTPVENRAGELHALTSVVLPGLLGSAESFRERFERPIAEGSARVRAGLARLIQPFVLRRLKRVVAPELPPRIEMLMPIELGPAERDLYERVREAAVAELRLAELSPDQNRRFQALALLTRLRQAACHPRLLDPLSTVPSSKLQRALELLDELREEGHQVLVFSQFVRHLELVREALTERGYRVGWLVGETPTEKRAAEVDRFQRGECDVFLLSLKAGGTGLNLTAATYVVHLDPWWNPAAEDQATDRAHRLGQSQTVTVVRLIARGTVEDAIVSLHGSKRELVEGLLAGTGSAVALTVAELTALLTTPPEELAPEDPAVEAAPTGAPAPIGDAARLPAPEPAPAPPPDPAGDPPVAPDPGRAVDPSGDAIRLAALFAAAREAMAGDEGAGRLAASSASVYRRAFGALEGELVARLGPMATPAAIEAEGTALLGGAGTTPPGLRGSAPRAVFRRLLLQLT